MEFKIDGEYIHLIQLLKLLNWAESGGEAKMLVEEGLVVVNDEVAFEKRKKIRVGDRVSFEGEEVEVR